MNGDPVASGILTLTTDFGSVDHYAGAMRGAAAAASPEVRVFDISHEVPSFDVHEGAFAIAQAFGTYPEGTVHVVVVDPGVGSERRGIAARAAGHLFVAPDNGVLSQVFETAGRFEVRRIRADGDPARISRTFHGRDVFAPLGARLAAGMAFEQVGDLVGDPVRLPPVRVADGAGRVLHVDRFGNVVTSFREADIPQGACLEINGTVVRARAGCYAEAPGGELFLVIGSAGYVEVSLNRASAAEALGAWAGAEAVLASE